MYRPLNSQALREYRAAGVIAEATEASPHRLVQMLFEGAIERISTARIAMEHGNIPLKGERISRAIDILEGLRGSLNMEQGGEISSNLEDLYIYMQQRLMDANANNDITLLDEVSKLLHDIKSGWDAIPPESQIQPEVAAASKTQHGTDSP